MRLFCIECGKPVSNELPEETIVRAICVCPECIAKQPIQHTLHIKEREIEQLKAAEQLVYKLYG